MNIGEIIFLAIGLAMDALAVSVCKGMSVKKISISHALKCGIYFGGFQALMPVIGFFIGSSFSSFIGSFDHWVIFGILAGLGINMIVGAFKEEKEHNDDFSHKTMLLLAIATSIDALAIGVSFSLARTNVWIGALMIGIITFVITAFGTIAGHKLGNVLAGKAELIGGGILIAVGVRILVSHLVAGT